MQEFEEKHEKHIEEILNVLETDQDRAQIVSDLHKFVDGYKIDISTARAAVIRKYGGNPEALFTPSSKPLAQIVGEEPNVNFRAKLLSVNPIILKNLIIENINVSPSRTANAIFCHNTSWLKSKLILII